MTNTDTIKRFLIALFMLALLLAMTLGCSPLVYQAPTAQETLSKAFPHGRVYFDPEYANYIIMVDTVTMSVYRVQLSYSSMGHGIDNMILLDERIGPRNKLIINKE